MTDYPTALAALRRGHENQCLHDWEISNYLAALDAQKPIGFVSVQKEGSLRRYEDTKDLMFDEEYGGYFNAPVYLAPPAAAVPAEVRAAVMCADLYATLTDVQNGIDSPGLCSMANAAIRRIDKARDAIDAAERKGVES